MIDGERRGPFRLEELPDAGVAPDTYVWSKGMDDWELAGDVADICRFYRQRIFALMHPSAQPSPTDAAEEEVEDTADARGGLRFGIGSELPLPTHDPENPDIPPASMLLGAVMMTLFCFPPTGFVAIYYSIMSAKSWSKARHSDIKHAAPLYSDEERMEYKRKAHNYSRLAKMWTGITFFLGIILYSIIFHKQG